MSDNLRGYSAESCRELDRRAIEDFGIPGLLLMEHASIGATQLILRELEQRGATPHNARVTVVCGPGNNGGDGYAVARHLFNCGCAVAVWELVDPATIASESDAGTNRRIVTGLDVTLHPAWECDPPTAGPSPDLFVDAIFGTGLNRPPAGRFERVIRRLNEASEPTVAIDVPSGLDADSGEPIGVAIEASATVTFGLPKQGFVQPGAGRFTGAVFCVPIGIPRNVLPPGAPAFPPQPVPCARDPR